MLIGVGLDEWVGVCGLSFLYYWQGSNLCWQVCVDQNACRRVCAHECWSYSGRFSQENDLYGIYIV